MKYVKIRATFRFFLEYCSAMLIHICFKFLQRRRINLDRQFMSKEFELKDVKKLLSSEANAANDSSLDELHQDISVRLLNNSTLILVLLSRAILIVCSWSMV